MRHDWVFDVLRDLKAYALANGLPGLAVKADEALRMARSELAASKIELPADLAADSDAGGGLPPLGRPH